MNGTELAIEEFDQLLLTMERKQIEQLKRVMNNMNPIKYHSLMSILDEYSNDK